MPCPYFGKDDIFSLHSSPEKDVILWLRDSSPTFTSFVVYLKHHVYICWYYSTFMQTKKQILLPRFQKMLEEMGENIKLARKRRHLTTIQVAERAGINRTTLYHIERGNPSVALGAYFNVLRVLGLQDDFLKLAADDELGRKLQDLKLMGK